MTDVERLILINQYELKFALGADCPDDDRRIEILSEGFAGDYSEYIFNDLAAELSDIECQFVHKVLKMVEMLQEFNPNYKFNGFSIKMFREAKYAVYLTKNYRYTAVKCENSNFLSNGSERHRDTLQVFNSIIDEAATSITQTQYNRISG